MNARAILIAAVVTSEPFFPNLTVSAQGIISISFGFLGDWGLGPTSVGAIVITGAYFLGMKLVYDAGRGNEEDELDVDSSAKSKMRAWIGFGAAGFVVLIADLSSWSSTKRSEDLDTSHGALGPPPVPSTPHLLRLHVSKWTLPHPN